MRRVWGVIFLAIVLACLLVAMVWGYTLGGQQHAWVTPGCTLGWNANTEPDLAGYRVYKSATAGSYTTHTVQTDSSTIQTTCAAMGLTSSASPYYLKVQAFDTSSNESGASNEFRLYVE